MAQFSNLLLVIDKHTKLQEQYLCTCQSESGGGVPPG